MSALISDKESGACFLNKGGCYAERTNLIHVSSIKLVDFSDLRCYNNQVI